MKSITSISWLQIGFVLIAMLVTGCVKNPDSAPTLSLSQEFDATLEPGGLQGFELAPTSSERCAYIAKIIPLEPSTDGASIKNFIEPECGGSKWHDVIRIVLPPEAKSPVKVHVLIYKISGGVAAS